MARDKIRFTVDLSIHDGRLDAFERTAREMIAGSQMEPGTLGYDWFLSEDRKRCRIVEHFADGNAALAHLTGPVVQQLVPHMLESAEITRFEVYGDPGPQASHMLAGIGAEVFRAWHEMSR